ncbi:hypothetical protein RHGRI_027341 [Rhododendron griersonianum]|uniref:ABC transporter domain-containing protein n=1 Tax=Rhododendron griersonianum TaxID=479676 RepID=A0AAV6J2W7_9ERIC|nr:hypothetical protein RHGRI_027341 [Rhododendron griersonianum]
MSAALIGDDLAVTSMSRRLSVGSGSRTSWATTSLREAWGAPDVFLRSKREEDEEELRWAALERLPTYDRLRQGIIKQVLENGRIVHEQVDVAHLGMEDRKILMESILKVAEDDNERFLQRLRERTDRVGIEIPKIEVRFEHLCVEGDAYVGTRALPTLLNSTLNEIEGFLGFIKLLPSKKKVVKILQDATGNITYCGHEMSEFIPQRTSAYISQHDLHHGEMTVRETLDFAGCCLGVGTRYELLVELSRREKESGIKPDPEIDAFMKATAMAGQQSSLVTDYVLKVLGLDNCADIMVGDEMRRGISGGQKKRLTTGEMLVGPAKVFFMDEISTGLDSSTTFQIIKYMRQMVHIMDITMIISLLQPAPETYALFDEIILLSEGKIVYHGPRESVLEFFESAGFKCPERKGVADFLQEVTSKKDQEQYWFKRNEPYRYVSVSDLVRHFNSFHVGQSLCDELGIPYNRNKVHPAALATKKYGISKVDLFKACLTREWLLMKRNSFLYIFKTTQITIMSIIAFTVFLRTEMKSGQLMDGSKFYGALFFSLINVMFNGMAELHLTCMRLPVFFKQRDSLFSPHGLLHYQFGFSEFPYLLWNQRYGSFSHTTLLGLLLLLVVAKAIKQSQAGGHWLPPDPTKLVPGRSPLASISQVFCQLFLFGRLMSDPNWRWIPTIYLCPPPIPPRVMGLSEDVNDPSVAALVHRRNLLMFDESLFAVEKAFSGTRDAVSSS